LFVVTHSPISYFTKIRYRFSQLLEDSRSILPGASYERDPTVSYKFHKAVLHTMATCHSLRVVDGELVGDPLDLKMFEFTGWSFEEGEQKSGNAEDDDQNKLSPSVARPPTGLVYDLGGNNSAGEVSLKLAGLENEILITYSRDRRWSSACSNLLNSCLSYAELAPSSVNSELLGETYLLKGLRSA
jgi:magnesium-transporting ATPase (P-type)